MLPGAREFATVALLGLLLSKSALATVTLLGFPVSKFVFATAALPDLLLGVFASQSRCLYNIPRVLTASRYLLNMGLWTDS